jgi:N-acetylmuramoyl-L-alanine amidase
VIEVPEDHVRQKVFVVAGHGTRTNEGNLGAWCTREQDFTLRAASNLARMLDATGQFDAIEARTGDQRPSYSARLRHLERVGATAMIELHSDARADRMRPHAISMDGETCWRDDGEPGFTILVADREGTAELIEDRLALARALGRALADAGFTPWVGDNYQGLYEADEVPGVWRDRRRLFMLREPGVPSVLIETHNGKDGRETLRWEEPATHDAFGRAVLSGLLSFYGR